jgi:DNA-binding NarL/FixJ family response regulator
MNENSWQLHTGQENEPLMNFTTACECSQILIVDDIDMNRYVLKQIFMSKYGIHCDEATNGKEAIQLIKARSFQECCSSYKIIIMDFEMPIMNGILVKSQSHLYDLGDQEDTKVSRSGEDREEYFHCRLHGIHR